MREKFDKLIVKLPFRRNVPQEGRKLKEHAVQNKNTAKSRMRRERLRTDESMKAKYELEKARKRAEYSKYSSNVKKRRQQDSYYDSQLKKRRQRKAKKHENEKKIKSQKQTIKRRMVEKGIHKIRASNL